MSVSYSLPFDFYKSPSFFLEWNNSFKVTDMNSSNNFVFKYASYCPSNIEECLNGSSLSNDVVVAQSVPCSLEYDDSAENTLLIKVRNDVVWNIGDENKFIRGVFLCTSNGYVMGYSLFKNTYDVTEQLIIDEGTIIWSITDGV